MDLVDYDQTVFDDLAAGYAELATQLGIPQVTAIPLSALKGDNMLAASAATPWYDGPSLLAHLEAVDVSRAARNRVLPLTLHLVCWPYSHLPGSPGTLPAGAVVRADDGLRRAP